MTRTISGIKNASIILPALRTGDATGEHTIDLARLLTRMNISTTIVCNSVNSALPDDIQPLVQISESAAYLQSCDLTILQYPIWSPISETFLHANGTTIFWYHGVTPVNLWNSSEDFELLQKSERKTDLVWHADLAVCASPFTAAELSRHSSYPSERIRVVPLGIELSNVRQRPDPQVLESLRTKWNVHDAQILLYIGRVASNKRIDLLIDALAILADRYPKLVLLIVGDNSSTPASVKMFEQLTEHVAHLGLHERVVFTGRVDDVVPFYHLADIFVHASQHEGFCIPLIEAMAAEVPIIASESGAMPWVLNAMSDKSKATGLLFCEGSISDLALQIEKLLSDQNLRATFVDRARNFVSNFDKQNFANRMRDVILEAEALSSKKLVPSISELYTATDVNLHDYRVRSGIPVFGKLIESVRVSLTSHLKEAYLDRIIKRQVNYNRSVVEEIARLHAQISRLRYEIERLQQNQDENTEK